MASVKFSSRVVESCDQSGESARYSSADVVVSSDGNGQTFAWGTDGRGAAVVQVEADGLTAGNRAVPAAMWSGRGRGVGPVAFDGAEWRQMQRGKGSKSAKAIDLGNPPPVDEVMKDVDAKKGGHVECFDAERLARLQRAMGSDGVVVYFPDDHRQALSVLPSGCGDIETPQGVALLMPRAMDQTSQDKRRSYFAGRFNKLAAAFRGCRKLAGKGGAS